MPRYGKIEDVKKIHARAMEVHRHRAGTVTVEDKLEAVARNLMKRAERGMRLLRAGGWAELRQVASGSATQSRRLIHRKLRSQLVGIEQRRLPGRTVGKLGKEEEEVVEPAIAQGIK